MHYGPAHRYGPMRARLVTRFGYRPGGTGGRISCVMDIGAGHDREALAQILWNDGTDR